MRGQPIVYETLERLKIEYEAIEHDPMFTAEDMDRLSWPAGVEIAKNLFLRDSKGRRHFLVIASIHRAIDLRGLETALGTTRLSFASEERLAKYLAVAKGSVSPFAILNDQDRAVEVCIEHNLSGFSRIGVHPNDNSVTLLLTFNDLLRVMREHGNTVGFL